MVNLEKEEFLQRLNVRLAAMSSMLEVHESYIASISCNPNQHQEVRKAIHKIHVDLFEYIDKTDKQIQEAFARVKKEMMEDIK